MEIFQNSYKMCLIINIKSQKKSSRYFWSYEQKTDCVVESTPTPPVLLGLRKELLSYSNLWYIVQVIAKVDDNFWHPHTHIVRECKDKRWQSQNTAMFDL